MREKDAGSPMTLSLSLSGSINGLQCATCPVRTEAIYEIAFNQRRATRTTTERERERATAQRITTLTNMADCGRGASCWRVCHMMTPMGQERGLPHSREPSLPATLPSSIMARVRCEVVCQLDWVSSGGPLKPRWAVNAFTKWVVWVLFESLYPQPSWEGAVFVNTKPSYYQYIYLVSLDNVCISNNR